MPDFTARAMKAQMDALLAVIKSLSVALDRVEQSQRDHDERLKAIEARNGQRRTPTGN
jgi:hypothetical protein